MGRRVDYKDTFSLPHRLRATLEVMKSARAKNELMNIWESDILAIEDALLALPPANQPSAEAIENKGGSQ